MNNEDLKIIPYTATSISVIGRFIFMFLFTSYLRCLGIFYNSNPFSLLHLEREKLPNHGLN